MGTHDRQVVRVSPLRRIIADTGAVAARRHAVPAWFSVDVTDVLPHLGRRHGVSVTAYVASVLASAVAAHPQLQAVRDLRGRLVIARQVDVNLSVEVDLDGESFPMNHVLRDAASRAPAALHREMHRVRSQPDTSATARLRDLARWYVRLPGPLRRAMVGLLHRLPTLQQRLIGTVGLTSIGMHGRGNAVGLPFLVHTLDVLVGGVEERPGIAPDGGLQPRQHLWMSLVVDHDVVDGAPVARFVASFRDLLESGGALTAPDGRGPGGA